MQGVGMKAVRKRRSIDLVVSPGASGKPPSRGATGPWMILDVRTIVHAARLRDGHGVNRQHGPSEHAARLGNIIRGSPAEGNVAGIHIDHEHAVPF